MTKLKVISNLTFFFFLDKFVLSMTVTSVTMVLWETRKILKKDSYLICNFSNLFSGKLQDKTTPLHLCMNIYIPKSPFKVYYKEKSIDVGTRVV